MSAYARVASATSNFLTTWCCWMSTSQHMLTYADVCWHMLTYAHGRATDASKYSRSKTAARRAGTCMLTYPDICTRLKQTYGYFRMKTRHPAPKKNAPRVQGLVHSSSDLWCTHQVIYIQSLFIAFIKNASTHGLLNCDSVKLAKRFWGKAYFLKDSPKLWWPRPALLFHSRISICTLLFIMNR